MKVTVKGSTEGTYFSEIKAGEVFEYENRYYIKTDEGSATNLNSGFLAYFNNKETFPIVKAEVIINLE